MLDIWLFLTKHSYAVSVTSFYFNGKYWKENTSSFPIVFIWKKKTTNQENKQQKYLQYQTTAHIFEIPYTCLKNLFS